MIGRVGDDAFGGLLRESLCVYGVNVSGVTTHPGRSSGVAVIAVDDAAENQIIIVPGANGTLGSADLAHLDVALTNSDGASDPVRVLLLQLEIPLEAVFAAAQLAHQQGVTVILDPAPACPLPPELYALIDILTPNAIEAATLVGFPVDDENMVARAAKALLERGARNVIIKLGSKGVYWSNGTVGELYPAFPVESVDTVGAGDAFNGGLAVALNERHSIGEAITWGLAAGALSVTRVGAQPSMPNRDSVMQMLA
jgi:ribokinase